MSDKCCGNCKHMTTMKYCEDTINECDICAGVIDVAEISKDEFHIWAVKPDECCDKWEEKKNEC